MREKGIYVPAATELFVRPRPSDISILERVKVEQIMMRNVVALPPTLTVSQFFEKIAEHHHVGFPIINKLGKVIRIVTLQDAMKIAEEKRNNVSVGEICTKKLVRVYPDNFCSRSPRKNG